MVNNKKVKFTKKLKKRNLFSSQMRIQSILYKVYSIFECKSPYLQINRFVNSELTTNFVSVMKVIFAKSYLKELYENGYTKDSNKRFQPDIIKRYRRCIMEMIHSRNLSELSRINSLHYKKLKGNKEGISSIRVSDKYRIEFIELSDIDDNIITICNIIELSNHYK